MSYTVNRARLLLSSCQHQFSLLHRAILNIKLLNYFHTLRGTDTRQNVLYMNNVLSSLTELREIYPHGFL